MADNDWWMKDVSIEDLEAGLQKLKGSTKKTPALVKKIEGIIKERQAAVSSRVLHEVRNEITKEEVERRILRGFQTLRALPDREYGWLKVKSGWPECLKDHPGIDPAPLRDDYKPTNRDVDDMFVALGWLAKVPGPISRRKHYERILWLMSLGYSLRRVSEFVGNTSHVTIKTQKDDVIIMCWRVANARQ